MKSYKYLIFVRFQFPIDSDMRFYHFIEEIADNEETFINFIKKWVSKSKSHNSYVNIYRIEGCLLNKIAFIKQGDLFSL